MQGYPPPPGPGYTQPGYPPVGYGGPPGYGGGYPPEPPKKSNTLMIVLIIVGVLFVLGGGSCVVCVGFVSRANTPDPTMTRNESALDLEVSMRAKQIPVDKVMCPKKPASDIFTCELTTTTNEVHNVQVTKGGTKLAWEIPTVALLDGDKLVGIFKSLSNYKSSMSVPCFTGTLMKTVGQTFRCPVRDAGSDAGEVSVEVKDRTGTVRMVYVNPNVNPYAPPTPTVAPTVTPFKPVGKRTVDFICPVGKKPNGVVRAGCMCGNDILGTACGPSGFTDVQPTASGCKFTCAP